MTPATLAGWCRVPVAALLALLAWGALADSESRAAPSDRGAALPVATVLGTAIDANDSAELRDAILNPLLEQYAAERGLRAEPAEINAMFEMMRRDMAASGLTAADDLTPEEQDEVAAMRLEMVSALIRQWKINKALHEQYGGRILYQQLGPEPLDAYREFLRQRAADGAFAIRDQALEAAFWRDFTDDSIHDFMTPGSADEARAFKTPPWEQQP